MTAAATSKEELKSSWAKIIHAVDSPVTLFALAVLVSDAVFALAGAWCQNEKIMIFSMHMFLAILAAFVLVSVWQPVVLYHPRYWHMCKKKEKSDWIGSCVITIVLASSLVAYMSYRYLVDPRQDEIVATHSSGGLEDPVIVEGAEFKMKSCQKANKQIICIVVIDAPADLSSIRVIGLPAVG